ncbi:MAG: gfo/Idh/MocA family oxidoreductase, partial [Bacteroidota bacterium]
CVRNGRNWKELRCNGRVAMADAIMALTANLAMKHKKRIVFKEEWFDADNDAVPETDAQIQA